jgi:putative toxin-antitoxin system antitoxin component (TIGR02293 family)
MKSSAQNRSAARIAHVVERANVVFGDPKRAAGWLSTTHPILGNQPRKLLTSDAGAKLVLDELTRIDLGDFA